MANYRAIMRHHPEVRDYIRLRKWVNRGEAVFYAPNIESAVLSTDPGGHRNGSWNGARLTLADCLAAERYGLVLGSSNVYGFGVPSDGHTIPSRLGRLLGTRFGNISLPEAHSRNLFAILLGILTRAPRPAAVLLLTGGDFTGWAYSGIADPVFGSPNLLQLERVIKEQGRPSDPLPGLNAMLAASQLWTQAIAQLCRAWRIPFVLGNDTTFFEKDAPEAYDLDCGLGVAASPPQQLQFDMQRTFGPRFYAQRRQLAARLGVALPGPGPSNQIGFVDEFHYDAAGVDALCAAFAPALDEALRHGAA